MTILFFVILIIFLMSDIYLIEKNDRLRLKLTEIANALQHKRELYRKSFLRNQELLASTNNIYIPKDRLFNSNPCNSYMLTYFYSGAECEKCILKDIDELRKLANGGYFDNIYIFPVFNHSRNVEIAVSNMLYGLKYAVLDKNEVVLPSLHGRYIRFFAILTPEGEFINIFFPDILMPEKTSLYIEFVRNKYL